MTDSRFDFLSNEPVSGELLSELLSAGPLTPDEVVRLAIDISSALHQIHSSGHVHGGLSPFSIALSPTGARILTPTTSPEDSAAYRSPEQVRGQRPDARSDVFAFGAILYELASGRRAFADTGADVGQRILNRSVDPLPTDSPAYATLEKVIGNCLEKDPSRRLQRIKTAIIELKFNAPAKPSTALIGRPAPGPGPAVAVPQPCPVSEIVLPSADLAPAPKLNKTAAPSPVPRPTPPPIDVSSPRPGQQPFQHVPPQAPPPPPAAARPSVASRLPVGIAIPRNLSAPYNLTDLLAKYGSLLRPRFGVIGGAILALAATAVGGVVYLNKKPSAPAVKFSVSQPENTSFPGMPSVSPDGRYLTFSAVGPEGKRMLWLRPLDALHASVIQGSEGASAPFWSPDSQMIAFFAHQNLMKVKISGGAPEPICEAEAAPGGGAWNTDGTILFAPGLSDGLYRVSAKAGKPQQVFKLDETKSERADMWPQFLPDQKHFVFYQQTDNAEGSGIYVGSLDSPEYHRLFSSQTNAVFSASDAASPKNGYLLYVNEGNLMSQEFNSSRLETTGKPTKIADDLGAVRSLALAPISVSATGVLVYQGVGKPTRQMVWLNRQGKQITIAGDPGEWGPPRISPDGNRAAAGKLGPDGKKAHLWVLDVNGTAEQITPDSGPHEGAPVWSPDASRLAYFARNEDYADLYVRPVARAGKAELLVKSSTSKYPTDWSRDGKYLLFGLTGAGTRLDVWGLSVNDRRSAAVVDTIYSEAFGAVSPDGKWLAYQSDQSGRTEVYIQQFDGLSNGTKRTWMVSKGGGLPRWRYDSSELFYITPDGRMMSVAVRPAPDGLDAGLPQMLFQTRPVPGTWNLYDVANDGQRFLLNVPLEWTSVAPITVVTNWIEKLKE